jgi:hypothetical protein
MSTQFDASLIHSDPVSEEVLSEQRRAVESAMRMPGALANVKLHAQNELQRLVSACNRMVWGSMPADMRGPTPEEAAALMDYLRPDDRDRLLRDAKLASEQRRLVDQLLAAENLLVLRQQAERAEQARREAEQREFEEFEAHDAAEKPKRFQAWRAARRS